MYYRKIKKKGICFVLITIMLVLALVTFGTYNFMHVKISTTIKTSEQTWRKDLYTPTMIQKIGDDYFIIDCWHHRIIYNNNLKDDISKWSTLTDEIKGGHTIASDGDLYLVDDTDNSKIRVFKKSNSGFKQIQVIKDVNARPHFILYDKSTKYFYCISSQSGTMWILKNDNGVLKVIKTVIINEIKNSYVRSFSIIDGYIYLPSGPGYIFKIKYDDESFKVIDSYKVPDNMVGMNYITKIDNYFYITSYTNRKGDIIPKFVRVKDLNDLKNAKYEDLYKKFGFKGTPYYISNFDNKYFITEIDASSGVKSFGVNNNKLDNIKTLFYFKGHSQSSEIRKKSKY